MRFMKNKGIACILMSLLIVVGVLFVGTPSSKVLASDTDKFTEQIFTIKCRVSDDKSKLRIVTTIDGAENYKALGFEITFLAQGSEKAITKKHTVSKVFRKIDSKIEGMDYDFSPNVFNTGSEWFATCTVTGIPEEYRDNYILIKPHITVKDTGKKVYGQSRYLKMDDLANGIVSVAVKGELDNPTIDGKTIESKYFDGTYTHVRVKENANYAELPSITKYTVKDGSDEYTARYRYLHSEVANDDSWYTQSDADDKVIVTTGDMQGFQLLSKTKTFEGEVINLGADINLNNENWSSSNPTGGTKWNPIGRSSIQGSNKFFCGTFDGNMHSISGVYVEGEDRIGLFGFTHGATIKNFELKNSYIKSTRTSSSARAGSVVGTLMGTLESVKADETVYVVANGGQYVGGLVGNTDALGVHADGSTKNQVKSYITNCWFAGTVSGSGMHHGGIVGAASTANNDSQTVIQQCLMSGTIEQRSYAGGIVGNLESGCTLEMSDILYAGAFTNANATSITRCTTVLGYDGGKSFSMTNVYVQADALVTNLVETQKDTTYEGAQVFDETQLTGESAYGNMDVDFYLEGLHEDAAWFARGDKHPILTTFAGDTEAIDLTTASGTRTYWHQPTAGADEFIIYTAADFRGFQALSKDYDFKGDTVKLGADIDLNPGWDASNPTVGNATKWSVIGRSGATSNYQFFSGTFDGNMHSISGVYVQGNYARVGLFGHVTDAIIKNFVLKNSYIASTATTNGRVGSIVGTLEGTLDTVKADETVYVVGSATEYVGGFVGNTDGYKQPVSTIKNCWFAGSVSGTGNHRGGILGGATKMNAKSNTTIQNCLVTGDIEFCANVGGIVGTLVTDCTLAISDTLFAGTIHSMPSGTTNNHGLVLGNRNSLTPTMTNVYALQDNAIQYVVGNKAVESYTGINVLTQGQLTGSAAYCNMDVDFCIEDIVDNATWTAIQNNIPALTSFADESQAIDLKTATGSRTFWYQPTDGADEFIIYTAPDFRGFQALSKDYDFKGDTIKLGTDIDLNPGWDASNPTVGNATKWSVIGRSGATSNYKFFSGIFDGNMHNISGVYVQGNYARVGVFGHVTDATIKNFVLKNSYIASTATTNGRVGSIVGTLEGTLDTVKADETVYVVGSETEYVGGLVGNTDGYQQSDSTIKNCWFDGSVSGTGNHRGGILGGATKLNAKSNTTIQNCLVTGDIEFCANVGGIVGTLVTDCTLAISDTLFAGTIKNTPSETADNYGLVLGNRNSLEPTMNNVYVQQDDVLKYVVGNKPAETYTGVYVATQNQLIGEEAYAHLYVDFYKKDQNETGVWFAVKNSYPILTSFADTSKALAMTVDTSWFDAEDRQTSYTLNSAAEFRGFQKLAAFENFHGIEIKLGTDIDLNPEWKAGETAPTTVWTPIGRLATNASSVIPFRGTFNGQGHTIKGVYVSSSSDRIGLFAATGADAVITDFTLENSYIKSTNETTTAYASTGSIVGRLGGTLDTVKSSAEVVASGAQYAGGLVGDINSSVGATITNCWFAGHVGGTGSHQGQLLGGVRNVSGSDTKNTCTVTHCLATGTIDFKANTGGLVGAVWNDGTTLNISDSLYAGTFSSEYTGNGNHGSVVGAAPTNENQTVTVNVTNVYVQKDCGFPEAKKIGNVGASTHNEEQKANVKYLEVKELYLHDARENTALTIYPQGEDSSSDGDNKQYWWYVSETHPVLASFGTPVVYDKLKVATYNIGSCVKLDNSNHASVRSDIVNFIKEKNIDVCMLQEVDQKCSRTDNVKQAEMIATELTNATGEQYYSTYIATLTDTFNSSLEYIGSYGIAIVSRYPIGEIDVEELDFTGQNEKRAILKAMINVDGTDVAVINTHFDNAESTDIREDAVKVLKTMLDGIDVSTPVVFGGDLNQVYNGETTAVISTISSYLNSVTAGRWNAKTYPHSNGNEYQLDYIFTNNLMKYGYASVFKPMSSIEGLGESEISDHRPLVVNLYMNIK